MSARADDYKACHSCPKQWGVRTILTFLLLFLTNPLATIGQLHGPELAEQSGHSASVDAIVITPDSHWLVSAGHDFSVRLWDLKTGNEVKILGRHTREVEALALCPKGDCVVSGGNDQVLKLWALPSGRLIRTFTGHTAGIHGALFTQDGRILISASGDPPNFEQRKPDFSVRAWDVQTGKELYKLTGHHAGLVGVDLSPDGRLLATGSYDKSIKIWDLQSRKLIRTIGPFPRGVQVRFGRDAHVLAAASSTIQLRDATTGESIRGYLGATRPDRMAFSADKKLLAYANEESALIVNADTGDLLSSFRPQQKQEVFVQSVALSPDGKWLFTGYTDGSILQWNLATNALERELSGHTARVDSVALSPNGAWLAAGHQDSTVRVWSLTSGALEKTLTSKNKRTHALAFSPDSQFLVGSGEYNQGNGTTPIQIWEVASGKELFTLTHPAARVEFLNFSPDGRWLASGGNDGTVRIWDWTRRTLGQTLSPAIKVVAFARDGSWVATGSRDNSLTYWSVPSGQLLQRLPGVGWAYELSSDNKFLATTGWVNNFKVWDLKSLLDWTSLHPPSADQVNRDILVLDLFHRRREHTFRGHNDFVSSIAFSPNGQQVASGSWDGQIKVWDPGSGHEMFSLIGHSSGVESVVYSQDGRWLVSGGWDGSVRIWDMESKKEAATLLAMRNSDNWLAVSSDGLFDGTEEAMHQIAWRGEDDHMEPLESFFADFFHPGLLSDVWSGTHPRAAVDIATVLQVPSLRLMLSRKQAHVEVRAGTAVACFEQIPAVAVRAAADDGPDLPAEVGAYRVDPNDPTCKYQKQLVGNTSGRELAAQLQSWRPEPPVTRWDGKTSITSNSTLHVLTVGVGLYSQGSDFPQIPYAAKSARAIEEFFVRKAQHKNSYAKVRVWPGLYDGAATHKAVRQRLNEMARVVKSDDVVFLYFAGHGIAHEEMFYFATSDTQEKLARETGLSTALLAAAIREMPSQRVAVFIDACESGSAVEALGKVGQVKIRSAGQRPRPMDDRLPKAGQGYGVYIVAATTPKSYAVSLGDRSALSVVLLRVLNSGNNALSMRKLVHEVEASLPVESEKAVQFRQVPLANSIGLDFPVF